MEWMVRLAREDDIPVLEKLIPLSVLGLRGDYYSKAQVDAALGTVFGVDRQLILDGTYFIVEIGGASLREPGADRRRGAPPCIIGCGGWSKRKTLFGSDHQTNRDDAELNPASDSARIRAFFIHPAWARRGIGRAMLDECEKLIRAAKFKSIEVVATLPGVPFYAALGYVLGERSEVPLPNDLSLPIVRMRKNLS